LNHDKIYIDLNRYDLNRPSLFTTDKSWAQCSPKSAASYPLCAEANSASYPQRDGKWAA